MTRHLRLRPLLALTSCAALAAPLATAAAPSKAAPTAAAPSKAAPTAEETPADDGELPAAEPASDAATDDRDVASEPAVSTEQQVEELTNRVQELEDIVGELERKSALQRLGWSADYRVTLSSFRYTGDALDGSRNPDGSKVQVKLRNYEQWTHRARLSIQADPTPHLRFRARLVAYKRFGDTANFPVSESQTGRVPRDNAARFDRFWFDWFVTDRLSLSFGRLSTTDGSPAELRENLDRPASTVSIGLVDSEYDSVATTYQVDSLLLRAFYLAWQFHRAEDSYGELPFIGALENPLRILGFGLKVSSERRLVPTIDVSSYLTPAFRAVSPVLLPLPDGSLLPATKVPDSLGSLAGATALLLWRDLARGLDLFVSGSLSYAKPSDDAVEFPIGPAGESVPVLTLVSADSDQHLGYHLYTGFRFTLPRGGEHAPRIGAEFTYGSRYLVTFSTPTTDLVTRQGVRGKTYDAYLIQPIYASLFARLSYTLIDQDYAPPLEGALGQAAAFGGTAPATDTRYGGVNLALHATF